MHVYDLLYLPGNLPVNALQKTKIKLEPEEKHSGKEDLFKTKRRTSALHFEEFGSWLVAS